MRVEPAPRRSHVVHGRGLYAVQIDARQSTPLTLLCSALLCGWVIGLYAMIGSHGLSRWLLVPVLSWLYLGWLGGLRLWWELYGRELITVSEELLIIDRNLPGSWRRREYDRSAIRNLRVSPSPRVEHAAAGWSYSPDDGVLAFDYGAETHRFGARIAEAEGAIILAEIAQLAAQKTAN